MPSAPTMFNKLAAHTKAHLDSVNAAYVATYSCGSTTSRPSLDSHQSSTGSTSSSASSLNKAWTSIKKHAREHHENVNSAYSTYYGTGMRTPSSSSSPTGVHTSAKIVDLPLAAGDSEKDPSRVEVNEVLAVQEKQESHVRKMARALKERAIEHHRSVNAAHTSYYGRA